MDKQNHTEPIIDLISDAELDILSSRLEKGELLNPEEMDIVLQKQAQDLKSYINKGNKSPITYLSNKIGLTTSAINSYFFTMYGSFQKALTEKVNPYLAFTTVLVHAINFGYLLGQLKKGGSNGQPDTSDTITTESIPKIELPN